MKHHALALLLLAAGLTCSQTSPPAAAVGSSGGERDAGCVRTFDPHTGAENPSDCPPPPDSQCGAMRCRDDGACELDTFPLGAGCDDGACDDAGMCKPPGIVVPVAR